MEERHQGINEKGILRDEATNYITRRLEEEEANGDDSELMTAINDYFKGYRCHQRKQLGTEEEGGGVTDSVSTSLCSRHFWLATGER